MKLLFVCTTEFQLLTALNIKYHMYADDIADIIVDNYHGEEASLAQRIRETRLFRNVCYVNSAYEQKTLHAYVRGISDGEKTISILEGISNSLKFVESRIKEIICSERGYLSVLVHGFDTLMLDKYDALFAYGGKPITRKVYSYMQKNNTGCKIIQLDEGVGSYYVANVGGFGSKIDFCALYEPDVRTIPIAAIKIPKISKTDKDFLKIVNLIFEYDDKKTVHYKDSIIFFDQGVSNPLPKYLRNASKLKKMIFHNSYTRHKIEEEEFNNRTKVTLELLEMLKGREVWVKPHPRSASEALKIFSRLGKNIKIMPQFKLPWEVIALNSVVEGNCFLSCVSSSVCLYPSVIEEYNNTNKSILLRFLYKEKFMLSFEDYLDNLQIRFSEGIMSPKDKEEYYRMLGKGKRF